MPIVDIKGVGEIEFPDDMTPEQIKAALDAQFGSQQSAPQQAPSAAEKWASRDVGNPWLESALQGASFGFSDEGEAGLQSAYDWARARLSGETPSFGDLYDINKAAITDAIKAYKAENPVAAGATEIGGGLTTGLIGAAKTIPSGLSLGKQALRGAVTGAGLGALGGAGYSEAQKSEGLLGDTALGAAAGGVIGGSLPAVTTVAGKVLGPLAEMAKNKWAKPATKAARLLARDMERDRLTPMRAEKSLRSLGPDGMLTDVGGANVRALADQVARQPGPGQNIAQRAVRMRDLAQGDRVSEALSKALGKPKNYYDDIDRIVSDRTAAARPLYESAVKPTNLVPGDSFENVAGDEFMQSVFRRVKADPLYGMKDMPDNAMPVIDAAKKRIDDMIEVAKRGGQNNRVRLLQQRKDSLVQVADNAFPEYAQARSAFESRSRMLDAMEDGAKFIKQPSQMTSKQISALSESDREFFRLGAARAIQDKIEAAGDGRDLVKRIFGSSGMRSKLEAVFPDKESFRQFEKAMRNEAKFQRTKAATAVGSQTAGRQAKARELGGPGALMNLATGNVGQAALGGARNVISGLANPLDDATSAALSRMLFSADQATQQAIIKQLQSRQAPSLPGLLGRGAAIYGESRAGSLLGD